jgi:hypothetical protein
MDYTVQLYRNLNAFTLRLKSHVQKRRKASVSESEKNLGTHSKKSFSRFPFESTSQINGMGYGLIDVMCIFQMAI